MTLNYQRWTPVCGCSFEEEVNTDNGEITLLFAHSLCPVHEPIAEQESKLLKTDPDTEKNKIISKKEKAWKDNSDKNLLQFDNTPHFKSIVNKVKLLGISNVNTDPNTQLLFEHYNEQREVLQNNLIKFTRDRKIEMLLGLQYKHSLNASKVHNKVRQECAELNTNPNKPNPQKLQSEL